MDSLAVSCNLIGKFYGVDGDLLERQYKNQLSGFRDWDQLDHADDWILFPQNVGSRLSIDETSLSNGELYTILTNKAAKGRRGSLVAMVRVRVWKRLSKCCSRCPGVFAGKSGK